MTLRNTSMVIIMVISFFYPNIVFSQTDIEITKLNTYFENNHRTVDSLTFFTQLNTIYQQAVNNNDNTLKIYTTFIKARYYGGGKESNKILSKKLLTELLPLSQQLQKSTYRFIEGDILMSLGNHIHRNDFSFDKDKVALDYMLRADAIFRSIGYSKCPNNFLMLSILAEYYHSLGEHEQSLKIATEAQKYIQSDTWVWYKINFFNNIALSYQALDQYELAIANFEKIIPLVKLKEDSLWVGLTKGNIGYTYYKQGKLDEAVENIKIDLEYSSRFQDICSVVNDLELLSKIEQERKNYTVALKYIREAEAKAVNCSSKATLKDVFSTTSAIYKDLGNSEAAYIYLAKAKYISDSINTHISKQKVMQTTLEFEKQKTEFQVQLSESERLTSVWQRNFMLTLLAILGLSAYFWYRREQQRKIELMEKQARESIIARNELLQLQNNIRSQNELIEKFKTELENRTSPEIFDEKTWEQLLQSTILTDKDWLKFTNNFDKVYPNYIQKLQKKVPNLSQGELRLLLITYLQINTRDMASMLGVSIDAIRKSRYRLRKKLELPEEDDFKKLLESV